METDAVEVRYARTTDGVDVAYQVVGAGPVVVWLPSLSHVRLQWRVPALRRAYEHLARHVTLVLYDARGTGSSDRRAGPEDLALDAQLRDLEAVLDAVGPCRAHLFGYYHSVAAALAFAAAHPERVGHLLLFGGAARMRDAMGPAQTQALLSLVGQDWDLFADTAARTWLGWDAGENGPRVADVFRAATTPAFAAQFFAAAARLDVSDVLPRVVAPALVLHRQGAAQIPADVSRGLAARLPHGRFLELPGATPTIFLEESAGDLELVTRWFVDGEVTAPAPARDGALTPREGDVLRLLAAGDSNAQIARALGIAEHTVERHAANLYRKIGARGRADATAWAIRHGRA
ncbi:alpha/beta fold hydrolase [Xylanimonas sp. McL0601]|uniref:alpha/beta fold hydrolase n=1 Tax=Xylanimonas sp. McL0601 TaxID=3414739 RepID=UPI003CEE28E5